MVCPTPHLPLFDLSIPQKKRDRYLGSNKQIKRVSSRCFPLQFAKSHSGWENAPLIWFNSTLRIFFYTLHTTQYTLLLSKKVFKITYLQQNVVCANKDLDFCLTTAKIVLRYRTWLIRYLIRYLWFTANGTLNTVHSKTWPKTKCLQKWAVWSYIAYIAHFLLNFARLVTIFFRYLLD